MNAPRTLTLTATITGDGDLQAFAAGQGTAVVQ
jgi:hypothetical protein